MKVLKATQNQYDEINGVSNKHAFVEFLKDINDNWITSINCKTDSTYHNDTRLRLQMLDEIEYEPKPDPEISENL